MTRHFRLFSAAVVVAAAFSFTACGSDSSSSDTTASTAPSTTTPGAATTTVPSSPTTDDGGGGMSAGAPSFTSFTVTSPVACEGGNADVTMAFTTANVVSIEIKVGSGGFASTAGYGPNETAVLASVPCSGAGESSIQLRGCTEDNECADSERLAVKISG
jgi:hypothetical protein